MSGAASTDRRLLPANSRVAASHLKGQVSALSFVPGQQRRVVIPVADLYAAPEGARDRQLLFGAEVTVYEERDGWAFVQAKADGYVGYVGSDMLGEVRPASHRVTARATHVYSAPDFKSPDVMTLSLGTHLLVEGEEGRFARIAEGFVPMVHLSATEQFAPDPVAVAESLIGTPYLWAGNSAFGIDCSGLVQIACHIAGKACPGDSDLQEAAFSGALAKGPARRGDLLFWKGHVAWVADPETILHANAHHMAVAYENLDAAVARIAAQGEGPVTAHVRPFA